MDTFLLVLTNAIGGSTYPANAVMLRGFNHRDALFVRTALCALFFLPILWRARRRLAALTRTDWALMSAVSIFGYALPLGLGNYGQTLSTSSTAALFIGMEPVTIVVLSCIFLGERLTGLKLLSMIAGLTGATLIAFQGPPHLGAALGGRLIGNLVLASAGCCWALYTVIGKPVLARVEPSRQANSIFLQPVVGVALGAGFLGDPLTRWTAAGGALVLAGMWAATRAEPESAAAPPAIVTVWN